MEKTIDSKISIIDDYIIRLSQAIENNDSDEAKRLQSEVISVYGNEIDNITSGLDNYDAIRLYSNSPVNYIGDARLLKAKLINYKANLSSGLYGLFQKDGNVIELKQIQHAETQVNVEVEISFEKAMENIDKLPDDVLAKEDKELLQGKLLGIERAKKNGESKTAIWEKIKPVLMFLVDKGADAAIAAMPYIITLLQKLG